MPTTAKEIKIRAELAKGGKTLKKAIGAKGVNNCGGYRIVDDKTGDIVAGAKFDLTLDGISTMIGVADFAKAYYNTFLK